MKWEVNVALRLQNALPMISHAMNLGSMMLISLTWVICERKTRCAGHSVELRQLYYNRMFCWEKLRWSILNHRKYVALKTSNERWVNNHYVFGKINGVNYGNPCESICGLWILIHFDEISDERITLCMTEQNISPFCHQKKLCPTLFLRTIFSIPSSLFLEACLFPSSP